VKQIHKITTGFVTQRFDAETGKFLGQEFTASDQVEYEDEAGNVFGDGDVPIDIEYHNFDMVQD
jgi:hypothetical protein